MIVERMLELELLHITLSRIPPKCFTEEAVTADDGRVINVKKMYDRLLELQDEFISPYVIAKPSKEV